MTQQLANLFDRHRGLTYLQPEQLEACAKQAIIRSNSGELPHYVPLLASVDRAAFAAQIRGLSGQIYTFGNEALTFPLMSVVKPFVLLYLLCGLGEKAVFECVSREPSTLPFNSLTQLEQDGGKPRNPMINSGAIALTSLIPGKDAATRCQNLLDWLNCQANCQLFLDELTLDSVNAVPNQSNRNLAVTMGKSGCIQDTEIALASYNHVCCLSGNIADLTKLGMLLANSGKPAIAECSAIVIELMATCGLYEASADFAVRVGFPAKSGVSGAILAIVPGEGAIGCYSPPLDKQGNSAGGLFFLEQIAKELRVES
ncbi:MAG: glutaminase [Microcoleus sp.]